MGASCASWGGSSDNWLSTLLHVCALLLQRTWNAGNSSRLLCGEDSEYKADLADEKHLLNFAELK